MLVNVGCFYVPFVAEISVWYNQHNKKRGRWDIGKEDSRVTGWRHLWGQINFSEGGLSKFWFVGGNPPSWENPGFSLSHYTKLKLTRHFQQVVGLFEKYWKSWKQFFNKILFFNFQFLYSWDLFQTSKCFKDIKSWRFRRYFLLHHCSNFGITSDRNLIKYIKIIIIYFADIGLHQIW